MITAQIASPSNSWQKDRIGAMTRNVELLAYHDLGGEGHAGYQMAMHYVNGRWYLYMVHWYINGITVMDVTEPSAPKLIRFVPEPSGKKGLFMVKLQVADGIGITHMQPRTLDLFFGTMPADTEYDEGILVWDFKDPENPKVVSRWHTGADGTHRNFYNGGRYVHLSASCRGYSGNIYRILDIADPAKPVEVGRWALPGQFEPSAKPEAPHSPRVFLHGPPYVQGNKAYISYAGIGLVILDISDVTSPKHLGTIQTYPLVGGGAGGASVHTCLPLSQRSLAVLTTEGERPFILDPNGPLIGKGKAQPLQIIGIIDVADPTDPKLLSIFPKPVPPPDSVWGDDYSVKDGVVYPFGVHNLHQPEDHPDLEDRNDRIYATYFQAGLRVYDIANEYAPKEIAAYCPPDPKKWNWQRYGGFPGKLTMCTEDIIVDKRGYIYMTNDQDGLHILRVTV